MNNRLPVQDVDADVTEGQATGVVVVRHLVVRTLVTFILVHGAGDTIFVARDARPTARREGLVYTVLTCK